MSSCFISGVQLRTALLILIAAVVYTIGNAAVPLWDRDEPRNAQAARQMYQSGDWVVPRFLDKVRTAKPVFTYWCQASAMHLLGDTAFAARLPSVIGITLTLVLLAAVISRYVDAERAFWTVFVLATSGIVIAWSARNSLTDGVLLLWVTMAQICLCAMLTRGASWFLVIVMSIAIGLALLTKGPVVLGVMAMTLLVWLAFKLWLGRPARAQAAEAEARARRPSHVLIKAIVGIALVAVIVAPWVILVERRAPGFLYTTASHDVARRIFEPLEQHGGPPGYYALIVWGTYFPWSLLLPMTFVVAFRHFKHDPLVCFALAATIGPWLLFECIQTKLPHYLLPVFPAMAFLTADGIVRCLRRGHPDLLALGTRIAAGVWAVVVVGLACAPLWLTISRKDVTSASFVVAPVGVAYAIAVLLLFNFQRIRAALLTMGLGMIALMITLFAVYLPRVEQLRLSQTIAAILKAHGGGAESTQPGDVQMIAYKEPSLAFYQGGTIREQSENDFLQTHPRDQWPRFLTIREDIWQKLPDAIKQELEVLGTARGWAYADKGRMWTVYVVRAARK
jgi:4-amino-4-deoxy-L-arabinose transferase-like glycosyltransferase